MQGMDEVPEKAWQHADGKEPPTRQVQFCGATDRQEDLLAEKDEIVKGAGNATIKNEKFHCLGEQDDARED